jgi:hypothetical protein
MKTLICAGVASALLMCAVTSASATQIAINFDENCDGVFITANGQHLPLSCALQSDPGPGGLSSALTLQLGNPTGLVAGDLLVEDSKNNLVDLIRFNPSETINGQTGALVYYRVLGSTEADTGFPTLDYVNTLTVHEGPMGNYAYFPTAGEPGYSNLPEGVTIVYDIGDQNGAPEPASAMLMFGAIGLLAGRKFLLKTRAARV